MPSDIACWPAIAGCDSNQWRCRMAKLPPPPEGIALTHFIVSGDVERSRNRETWLRACDRFDRRVPGQRRFFAKLADSL
jgi:hypothetical protein